MMFPHVGDRFRLVYGRNLLPELTEGLNNYLVVADGFVYEKYKDFKISDYGYAQLNQYVKSIEHIKVEQVGTILKAKYIK